MAESPLMRFEENDEFLRRVRFANLIKRDIVAWQAFKEKDKRMSWTFRDQQLMSQLGLEAYHRYFSEQVVGGLPAILRFTFFGLTQCINPPLQPEQDRDSGDPQYGHLHCSTGVPDEAQMRQLAKLVNDGQYAGIARRYSD